MSQEIAAAKRLLRRQVGDTHRQVQPTVRVAESVRLCDQLRPEPVWVNASSVLLFCPMSDEPDIRPLIEEAWKTGKIVTMPRFDSARQEYDIFAVQSWTDLREGHYGIKEPSLSCPGFKLNRLDLALIPGVAFDTCGGRVGRGKGYFDRLLAQVPGHKCGVAFGWQLVDAVPVESHDVRLNSLLTPSRWFRCAG